MKYGYVWFWKGMSGDVEGEGLTRLAARTQVVAGLRKKGKKVTDADITVELAEKDGVQVTHKAVD